MCVPLTNAPLPKEEDGDDEESPATALGSKCAVASTSATTRSCQSVAAPGTSANADTVCDYFQVGETHRPNPYPQRDYSWGKTFDRDKTNVESIIGGGLTPSPDIYKQSNDDKLRVFFLLFLIE